MATDSECVRRFRRAAELLSDPVLDKYKRALPSLLSPQARGVLERHCGALLQHIWTAVSERHGIHRDARFWVVFGDLYNVRVLTCDEASAWARVGADDMVACVDAQRTTVMRPGERFEDGEVIDDTVPEVWIAMAAAETYRRPAWLV